MKIEKYEKIGNDKYRLYLDNGEVLDTYDEVILKNDLLLKKELPLSLYQTVLLETKTQEYYYACLKYISIRLRSKKEIQDYLKRKQVSTEDITKVVEKLEVEKILDDDKFCQCFIKDKLRFTTMGKYRIINELKKHQIDNIIIQKYEDLMNDEIMMEKINNIIQKQIQANHKLDDYKLRNKLYHNLSNLGYPQNLVIDLLNQSF